MEEGEERLKFPKLTMMEEVLLLGLKDKQVCPPFEKVDTRDTCHFGTTTFRIRCVGVSCWNWRFDQE
jgi:hypothetical protein